jgi:hypothetical protein
MKRLHTLHFVDTSDCNNRKLNPDLIISVAGEVPSLRNFGFRCGKNQNQFIEEFAERYPRKELHVKNLMYVCLCNFQPPRILKPKLELQINVNI